MELRKAIRTLQHYLPGGRDGREALSRIIRRVGRTLHEPDFAALSYFPSGQLLLDVGANYGQSAACMRRLQKDSTIILFEPNRVLASKLTAIFRDDLAMEVRAVGLANNRGAFTLYIPYYRNFPYPGLASLNESEARSWLSTETLYFFRPENVAIRAVDCDVDTLDNQNLAPYFIKMDVQGTEFAALEGSIRTLSQHQPILLIESPGRDQRIGVLLESLGYLEYELVTGQLVQRKSQSTNAFFLTEEKRADLDARHPGLFSRRSTS